MGNIVTVDEVNQIKNSSLIIYCGKIREKEKIVTPIGIEIAKELFKIPEKSRTLRMDSVISKVIKNFPVGSIFDELDVLFNPSYKIDVLKLLIAQRKNREFQIIWPGKLKDNSLVYSEPGFIDYKRFNINNYNVTCVL